MQSAKPQIEAPFVVEHESITWKNLTPKELCRENFHSETVSASVLASRSFSRHSGEVAVFDCVCRNFACARFVTDKLLCDTGAEIMRNVGEFGLLCLCIFVT